MRTNAVIVSDDDPGRACETAKWLRESGIPAYSSASDFPGKRIDQAISELKPGIVLAAAKRAAMCCSMSCGKCGTLP